MVYIASIVAIVGAVSLGYAWLTGAEGLQTHRQNRAIQNYDGETSRSPGDKVLLSGTISANDKEVPAIGEGRTVAADIEVWEKGSDESEYLVLDKFSVPFNLDTKNGQITIDGDDISVEASDERTYSKKVEDGDTPPEEIKQFLLEAGIHEKSINKTRQYDQERVVEDDHVAVYGELIQDDGELKVAKGSGKTFFVTDQDPKELVENRKHALKISVVKAATATVVGILLITVGLMILF